jgi:hypothetical protein
VSFSSTPAQAGGFHVSNAKRIGKGLLIGSFDLDMPSGLRILGVMLFEKDGRRWVNFVLGWWGGAVLRRGRAHIVLQAMLAPRFGWLHYSRHLGSREGRREALGGHRTRPPLFSGADITPLDCGIDLPEEFSTRDIIKVIDHLAELGLIHHHKVKAYDPAKHDPSLPRYSSSFMATDSLRAMFPILPELRQRADDTIWLRDEYGRRKMLPDTPEVRQMRQQREAHNALMAHTEIRLDGYPYDGVKYRVGDGSNTWDVYTTGLSGHRVFNESFEYGGRIYGFWPQGVPMRDNPIRRKLLINGEPVVEQDYNAHHLRILYAWVGQEPPKDPYQVPGFDRKTAKLAMLVLINAGTERGSIQALVDREELKIEWREAKRLIEELKESNSPIAEFFHNGVGRELQRADSDVIEDAVFSLTKKEIPCVPIHDSLISGYRHSTALHDAMAAAWRKHFPEANCRIDVK